MTNEEYIKNLTSLRLSLGRGSAKTTTTEAIAEACAEFNKESNSHHPTMWISTVDEKRDHWIKERIYELADQMRDYQPLTIITSPEMLQQLRIEPEFVEYKDGNIMFKGISVMLDEHCPSDRIMVFPHKEEKTLKFVFDDSINED